MANRGKRWNNDDIKLLLSMINNNTTDIAKSLGRTECAIRMKTMQIAYSEYNGDNIEYIIEKYKLNRDEFVKFVECKRSTVKEKKKPNVVKEKSELKDMLEQCNYIMFMDTETTSQYPNQARLIEMGYLLYDFKAKRVVKRYEQLVKPKGFRITNHDIHGITHDEALTKGIDLSLVLDEFERDIAIADIMVCHNISYDASVMMNEARRNKRQILYERLEKISKFCTLVYARQILPIERFNLGKVYRYLFNKEMDGGHRALFDAEKCMECFIKMLRYIVCDCNCTTVYRIRPHRVMKCISVKKVMGLKETNDKKYAKTVKHLCCYYGAKVIYCESNNIFVHG